jgi:3-oxoadipate enol-lactonase
MIGMPDFSPQPAWNAASRLAYLQAGEHGPPLLFLHGWAAFKELWWNTLRRTASAYRCFAVDLPGHGGSPLDGPPSISRIARRMLSFCDDLDLQQVGLVGHSMGGSIATVMALQQPACIERLVLVDPAIDAFRLPRYIRLYLFKTYGWAILRLNLALARHLQPLTSHIPHEHHGGWLLPWLRRSGYAADLRPADLHALLSALMQARIGPRLARLTMPTLVISGQFDGLVPAAHTAAVARAIPGAQYQLVRWTLHNPMDERPRQFERVLMAFLGKQASSQDGA